MSNNSRTEVPRRLRTWIGLAALLGTTALCYLPSLEVGYIFDDRPAIERNESIRQLWPLSTPLQPPVTAAGAAGRPITNLSLAINHALHGDSPAGYHLGNLLLHLAAGLALFGLLRRTPWTVAADPRHRVAWTATGLWLVHPLLTESVVGIVQRNEILAGGFLLATLYSFVRYSEGGRTAPVWAAGAVGACALGMGSKEIMAAAPLLVFLFDRTFVSASFAAAWRRHGRLHVALASTWVLLAWLILQHEQRAGTVGYGLGMETWTYLLTQCRALALYLKLSFWPHPLVIDYGFATVSQLADVWLQGLLVLALLAATVVGIVRRSPLGFLGAAFFLILAPSSSFVPLTTQTIAEHRMYLPLAAVIIAIAAGLDRLVGARWSLTTSAVAAVLLGTVTWFRTSTYLSEIGLWTETARYQPENARAQASLAGSYVRAGRWEESVPHFETALRLRPDYADAQNDYANVLVRLGRIEAALPAYAAAWRLKPAEPSIRRNFAAALRRAAAARVQAGQFPEAVNFLADAAKLTPDDADLRNAFAELLQRQGNATAAAEQYRLAIALRPENPELRYNYGNLCLQLNRLAEAQDAFTAALKFRPGWAAAHHNLALTLVRSGRPAEAVPHYRSVLDQLPQVAQVHHNLALALQELGRHAEAIEHEQTALRLQPDFAEAQANLRKLRGYR